MSKRTKNPFEYEGANNLADDDILEFYIEDFNFSRTIHTKRNIFLIGERGSGKTMTLLYNSFKIQYKKYKNEGQPPIFEKIGVYMPCNTPLFHKKEYEFLGTEPFKASIIGEHYLAMSLIFHICETLEVIDELKQEVDKIKLDLITDLEYYLDITLKKDTGFFNAIKMFISKESVSTQRKINSYDSDGFYEGAFTFSSIVIPFFEIIKKIPSLENTHFLLMIDDAHDLNRYQIRTINSWIAYRDHSVFSFKVATAKVNRPELITATGGTILEGHDFITIDMEKPFQNEFSDFYKLAKRIVERRLNNIQIDLSAEEYFPISIDFEKDMEKSEQQAIEVAKTKYPAGTSKQINDFVYKYKRAYYFRNRSPRANMPPYSGFQTIVDISTGVIRNLLDPCYYMYESELDRNSTGEIAAIPSTIQTRIIIDRSKNMWRRLEIGLHKEVEGCSTKQSKEISNLFNQLMILFEKRLQKHNSEPRASSFTISQKNTNNTEYEYVIELLKIAQKAQLIYTRLSNSKDDGKQEIYYVPNRMLLPSRGLDPHGQFARVSIKALELYQSATKNTQLPFKEDDSQIDTIQKDLFNE